MLLVPRVKGSELWSERIQNNKPRERQDNRTSSSSFFFLRPEINTLCQFPEIVQVHLQDPVQILILSTIRPMSTQQWRLMGRTPRRLSEEWIWPDIMILSPVNHPNALLMHPDVRSISLASPSSVETNRFNLNSLSFLIDLKQLHVFSICVTNLSYEVAPQLNWFCSFSSPRSRGKLLKPFSVCSSSSLLCYCRESAALLCEWCKLHDMLHAREG